MFTGFQLEIVAYQAPHHSALYCVQCWRTPGDSEEDNELEREAEITRYTAEELAEGAGLYCDDCGAEIVAPDPEESGDEDWAEDWAAQDEAIEEDKRDADLAS